MRWSPSGLIDIESSNSVGGRSGHTLPANQTPGYIRIVAGRVCTVVPILRRRIVGRQYHYRRLVRIRIRLDPPRIKVPGTGNNPPPANSTVMVTLKPAAAAPAVQIMIMEVPDFAMPGTMTTLAAMPIAMPITVSITVSIFGQCSGCETGKQQKYSQRLLESVHHLPYCPYPEASGGGGAVPGGGGGGYDPLAGACRRDRVPETGT